MKNSNIGANPVSGDRVQEAARSSRAFRTTWLINPRHTPFLNIKTQTAIMQLDLKVKEAAIAILITDEIIG